MLIDFPKKRSDAYQLCVASPAADGLQPSDGRTDGRPSIQTGFYRNGVGWVQFCLAESQSRLYPHRRAKFGRDPTAGSKEVPFNFISRCFETIFEKGRAYILFNLIIWNT